MPPEHKNITRRQILQRTAFTAAGAAATKIFAAGTTGKTTWPGMASVARPARSKPYGANDRIRVCVIGPGDRAQSLMNEMFEFGKNHNAELVAACDLWSLRREQARDKIRKATGQDPQLFRNTEELYESRSVDAVIIATPDFSHALLCAEAVRAGMDVYVEKPLANTIEDAREVRQAVLDSGAVVQVGTQSRSSARFINAAKFVQSGGMGKINGVEMSWHVNQPQRWRRPKEVAMLNESDTDWTRYQLNRPKAPFDPRQYLEFRLFWPYSSGLPCQWMSHQIDTVAMVTGDPYPSSCVASGGIYQWHDGRKNPDTFAAIFEFPSGFQVRFSARQTNGYPREGVELFYSNQGTLDIYAGKVIPDGGISQKDGGTGPLVKEQAIETADSQQHMENWLKCVRDRTRPNADIEAGYGHSVAVSMAIKALHTGRKITYDPRTQELREV